MSSQVKSYLIQVAANLFSKHCRHNIPTKYSKLNNNSNTNQSNSTDVPTLNNKKRRLIEKIENHAESSGDMDLARVIESEVHSYLNFDVTSSANDNPLQFWKTHQLLFLAVLTRNYLCLLASSVPVEQMFSSTGILLNQKRSAMAPCRANVVSFIHDNHSQFFPLSYRESTEK